jgi:hypothetical protein
MSIKLMIIAFATSIYTITVFGYSKGVPVVKEEEEEEEEV